MVINMEKEEMEILHLKAKDKKAFNKSSSIEFEVHMGSEKMYFSIESKDKKPIAKASSYRIKLESNYLVGTNKLEIDGKNFEYEDTYTSLFNPDLKSLEKKSLKELKSVNMNKLFNKKGAKTISYDEFNQKMTVTGSYHALMFSLLMHSNFYIYMDDASAENSRLLSSLAMFGLEKQLYYETSSLPKVLPQVDFSSVDPILKSKREESVQMLKQSIKQKLEESVFS